MFTHSGLLTLFVFEASNDPLSIEVAHIRTVLVQPDSVRRNNVSRRDKVYYRKIGTRLFVHTLEEALLQTILDYGVKAGRKDNCPGLWWQGKKLASIGLEIKQGVSMHGCAININNSLEGFNEIVPCGFSSCEMISLSEILRHSIPLYQFGKQWQKNLIAFLYK